MTRLRAITPGAPAPAEKMHGLPLEIDNVCASIARLSFRPDGPLSRGDLIQIHARRDCGRSRGTTGVRGD